jgi:hypothetical protein
MIRHLINIKNFTFSLPNKEIIDKSIFELSKKKGLIPEEDSQKKEEELLNECDYFIQMITKTIHQGVDKQNDSTRNNLDKNKIKHLKYESFEKCPQYKEFTQSLKNIGISIQVYKSNSQVNTIEYKLLDKKVELFH